MAAERELIFSCGFDGWDKTRGDNGREESQTLRCEEVVLSASTEMKGRASFCLDLRRAGLFLFLFFSRLVLFTRGVNGSRSWVPGDAVRRSG